MNLQEIDLLVAEKVMKWIPQLEIEGKILYVLQDGTQIAFDWKPTTYIADAWRVVEKLIDEGYNINIYNHNKEFNVEIDIEKDDKHLWFYGEAESAPLAICLAALEVVGVKVEVAK